MRSAMWFFVGVTACGPGGLPTGTELFVQSSSSDAVSGAGYVFVIDAEVTCDAFRDYLADEELFLEKTAPHEGIIMALSYSIPEGAETEAWLGTYGVNATTSSGGASSGGDSGGGGGSWSPGSRSASVSWLRPDGVYLPYENSGLLVVLDEYSSDTVEMDFQHLWAEDRISAKNCGSW